MHGKGHSLKQLIDAIDLSKIERVLRPHYKKWEKGDGKPGRPPINPVGLTLAFLLCLLHEWSLPDLTDFLSKHPEWLRFLKLDHVPNETTWSKLLDRVPQEGMDALLAILVKDLHAKSFLTLRVVAADGSFLPGGHWDKEATWGYVRRKDKRAMPYGCYLEQDGKTLGLGYRLHALVDAETGAPLALHVNLANENDVSQWPALFELSKKSIDWDKVGWFVADKGYDASTVRMSFEKRNVQVVIPAANTPKDLPQGGFTGDRARIYKKRTSVERFFSMFKRFFSLKHWGIVHLSRVRKWAMLAGIAWLLLAWGNHCAGRRTNSLKAFLRSLR